MSAWCTPTYQGKHIWGKGKIVREIEPLVETEQWERAGRQLIQNKKLSKKPEDDNYLLRGLVKCECGRTFVGARNKSGRYYRCSGQTGAARGSRCKAKMVSVEWLEKTIWDDITLNFPDQPDFPEPVSSCAAGTIVRCPERVNCAPIHSIAPLS